MEMRSTLTPRSLLRLALLATLAATALIGVSVVVGAVLPRGDQMLYSHAPGWRSGPWSIFVMDVERRLAHRIAYNWTRGNPALPVSWSPDGQRIAYMSYPDRRETYLYNLATGRRQQIRIAAAADVQSAAWSPDSRRLAFLGGEGEAQVYVIDAEGGEALRVTPRGRGYMHLVWSADGQRIAFQNNASDSDIFVAQADGSAFANLTQSRRWRDINPAWSPDGQRIAFFSDRSEGFYDLYVMDADGRGMRRYHAAGSSGLSPMIDITWRAQWSPDGRFIAFGSFSWRGGADVYLTNLETGRTTNLTDDTNADSNPVWSPDGALLAFESRREGAWNAYLLDIACAAQPEGCAHTEHALIAAEGNFRRPVWSHDGSRIALSTSAGGGWSIAAALAAPLRDAPVLLTAGRGISFAPAWRP